MANRVLVFLLSFVSLFHFPQPASSQNTLVTYWGQNGNEGSLSQACQSGLYNIIILSFLTVFGNNQQPVLNLAGHCDPALGNCRGLTSDIRACQYQGIQVLLSIGGGVGSYDLTSQDDVIKVGRYLWDNYLGGQSNSRPLGPAILDGIDFDIELGSLGSSYYGSLAETILQLSEGRALLTAAPQCPFPDAHLGSALSTGLFNYVWVQFYNNPGCQYSRGNISALLSSWNQWTSSLPETQVLLGLPASDAAASGGFIQSDVLTSEVLPQIKQACNYGGVMLYSYFYDEQSGYGASIKWSL